MENKELNNQMMTDDELESVTGGITRRTFGETLGVYTQMKCTHCNYEGKTEGVHLNDKLECPRCHQKTYQSKKSAGIH